MTDFGVETIELDLPPLAGALSRRLHDAGVPVTPARAADFARALALVRPISRRRLYWTARAVLVSDPARCRRSTRCSSRSSAIATRDEPSTPTTRAPPPRRRTTAPAAEHETAVGDGAARIVAARRATATRTAPRSRCRWRWRATRSGSPAKSFDALEPHELAQLYQLMSRLQLATPLRRTRRYEKGRHGQHIDMRRTLRASLRTGGDPIRLARRHRRVARRRLVMLCDISGSMEPYARAYLQFLTCAAGSGPNAEAFVFATRLTRLTRALASRNPERAIQRAAAAAPDWSSGTRIGDALKAFNDRHGRRGMARGAVVVILSDGWERGDPTLVGPRDGAPRAARAPDRVGQPARRRERVLACGPAAWSPRCRTATRSSAATASRRSARSSRRSAARRPREPARGRARRRGGAVGQRDAGRGQLRRDAERARAEQGQHDAGMGDR